MNQPVRKTTTTSQAFARTPERWLLTGPSNAWCNSARRVLEEHAQQLPASSFLGWRLHHGLLQVVPASALDAALTLALAPPRTAGVVRNATRIWAALSESDWYAATAGNAALHAPSARGLTVSWLGTRRSTASPEDLLAFLRAADAPDALPRLAWLMNERPQPVPRDWLPLAPLAERSAAQNAAMAEAGYRCYAAWAQAVLGGSDPDELQALWGPYTQRKGSSAGAQVIKLDDFREPLPSSVPQDAEPFFVDRLAAESADGAAIEQDPTFVWDLVPSISGGANLLQAFVLPSKDGSGPPRIEFVASWDRKPVLDRTEDLRLVLTLSKRKPVLLKGRRTLGTPGQALSLRFAWPPERWPDDLPRSPFKVRDWLEAALRKARVSLQ